VKTLDGKKIVITGAGRGIGAACAEYAASLGAAVVINDLDPAPAEEVATRIRSNGGIAVSHAADISDWQAAAGLIDRCVTELGDIDGLVNNAGIFRMGRLDELSPEHLQSILATNVAGTAYCAHHAASRMIPKRKGAIVNITSGAQMGIGAMGSYGASKGAVASFTYAWALELGPLGIRVNAVSPMAETRMGHITDAYLTSHSQPLYETRQPPASSNSPAICYLLSDLATAVNGQVVRIEGRQLSLVAHPAIAVPVLEGDWTIETLAHAFDTELAKRLLPVGIHSAEVKPLERGSAFWSRSDKG
jgi:NAD(P)-dependent dehydrogenase (short-subunit alcohol dehydrogenase family)